MLSDFQALTSLTTKTRAVVLRDLDDGGSSPDGIIQVGDPRDRVISPELSRYSLQIHESLPSSVNDSVRIPPEETQTRPPVPRYQVPHGLNPDVAAG